MKAILLAAGIGTRLRPITDSCPKCMVPYQGRPILEHILEALRACEVSNVVLVKGYLADTFSVDGAKEYVNEEFATTNMVHSLFCAEPELAGDLVISYTDIVYSPSILRRLIASDADIAVPVDLQWRELWQERMEDPLQDAESLRLGPDGRILEIGGKPTSYDQVDGQYMGLVRLSPAGAASLVRHFHALDRNALFRGRTFRNLDMTTFLQTAIDADLRVQAVPVSGGWIEIDSHSDLAVTPVPESTLDV